MCLFINNSTRCSCMKGHHFIFKIVSQSAWTKFSGNSGRARGPVSSPWKFPALNFLEFGYEGKERSLLHSAPISEFEIWQHRAGNACQKTVVKPGTFDRAHFYMPESQKLCLKCVGIIQSICFNAHTTIASVSAGVGFCTFEDDEYVIILVSTIHAYNL
jgi:hypothetical protein